jgi:hypothetical protein
VRIPTLLAVLVAAALTATGCTGETPGNANPTSTPTSTSGSTGTAGGGDTTEHGAPKVKTPLDFAKSQAAPCSLLTAAQLQALGMATATSKDGTSDAGANCAWNDTDGASGQRVGFTFVPGQGGLDFLYQSKANYGLFEPQPPLQGHPTLLIGSSDERANGACGLAIGITDKQHILVTVKMRTGAKPAPRFAESCVVAKEAADLALTSIKGGS